MHKSPAGYQALIEQFKFNPIPHYRSSYIIFQGTPKLTINNDHEVHEYSKNYAPQNLNDPFSQLEFALKYDGINLEILTLFFKAINKHQLFQWVQKRPTGKYRRITWFLFEMLMEEKLDLENCKKIKYIDLLDPLRYFVGKQKKSSRHGVNNNLLGDKQFCPIVRRTTKLEEYINKKFDIKAKNIVKQYDLNIVLRANNYLLVKETMSSYEIEHEKPDKQRLTKFVNLLKKASSTDQLTKKLLIEYQNTIVDSRFIDTDYRHTQNYVGENISPYQQKIHFISPKPKDLPFLMEGLLNLLTAMASSEIHSVIIATCIAFGFVFLHPFEDGNGRLHRFLIHYVLSKYQFTPKEIIFPISAIMLKNIKAYDAILESFSKPLMDIITDYNLDNDGALTVNQETKSHYQYIDYTRFAEYLFLCIEETITVHLEKEIEFLINYDKTKYAIQTIVDMPDKLIDLFIRCLLQNNGELGDRKRKKYFSQLTQDELDELTEIVINHMIEK